MKKLLLLIISFIFICNVQAQVVTGFNNITDVNGNMHSLNTHINNGKYVILNFYLETCGNCMASAPMIQSIYNDYGQNQCNVIIWNLIVDSSSPYLTDQECINWMASANCTGPPNFNYQASSGSSGWGQFYSVHGGGFAQTFLIEPNGSSVIYAHAGGVLDETDFRHTLDSCVNMAAAVSSGASSVIVCDEYDWNGQLIISSGSYNQTFNNVSGCDSVHTLDLTINNSTSGSGSYTSPTPVSWNGQNITTTGSYTQILTNAVGCDSVATLNFILNNTVNIKEINPNTKTIVKVVDFLGREQKGKTNNILFYIYDNGTTEKRIIID